ncbi:hypothetical protein [Diaphorobacter nitroreducens]
MSVETDRELLKFAAKAAGRSLITGHPDDQRGLFTTMGWWNPLTNDGDAFRLFVKLRLLVDVPGKHEDQHIAVISSGAHGGAMEHAGDDFVAATRRAIVRAAAQIGRAMP